MWIFKKRIHFKQNKKEYQGWPLDFETCKTWKSHKIPTDLEKP